MQEEAASEIVADYEESKIEDTLIELGTVVVDMMNNENMENLASMF